MYVCMYEEVFVCPLLQGPITRVPCVHHMLNCTVQFSVRYRNQSMWGSSCEEQGDNWQPINTCRQQQAGFDVMSNLSTDDWSRSPPGSFRQKENTYPRLKFDSMSILRDAMTYTIILNPRCTCVSCLPYPHSTNITGPQQWGLDDATHHATEESSGTLQGLEQIFNRSDAVPYASPTAPSE